MRSKLPDYLDESTERVIREHCERGDHRRAATLVIERYGPEVLGFLVTSLRHREDAEDIFSQMSEDLVRGLPTFEWRASLRTWLYRLARNATARYLRAPGQRAARRIPLSEVSDVIDRARTETELHQKTEAKDALTRVRDALDSEDRMLLVLRIDRRLPWTDVARVLADGDLDDPAATRESARLRKRLQILKEELAERIAREMKGEEGGPTR
jgi:RNA polymerase sigma-70 factor (ECF subfamily)